MFDDNVAYAEAPCRLDPEMQLQGIRKQLEIADKARNLLQDLLTLPHRSSLHESRLHLYALLGEATVGEKKLRDSEERILNEINKD